MLLKFNVWAKFPIFWSSPGVQQQDQHRITWHSNFYRSKEALTVQAIRLGGSSLLQDGCISKSWMHLSPEHSPGSKQQPHFMIHLPLSFLNCCYLLEAHSCGWAMSCQCWLLAGIATKHILLCPWGGWRTQHTLLLGCFIPGILTLIFTAASLAQCKYWNFPCWRAVSLWLLLLFNNTNIQGTL